MTATSSASNGGGHAGFVLLIDAAIHHAMPELTGRTRDLMVAQAAWESKWGTCTGYAKGYNAWNVTAGTVWTGPVNFGPDTEVDSAGNVRSIRQAWRAYKTLEDAALDFLKLLEQPRFRMARVMLLTGDAGFAEALGRAKPPYYTLQIPKYVAGFTAALDEVQKLTKGVA